MYMYVTVLGCYVHVSMLSVTHWDSVSSWIVNKLKWLQSRVLSTYIFKTCILDFVCLQEVDEECVQETLPIALQDLHTFVCVEFNEFCRHYMDLGVING